METGINKALSLDEVRVLLEKLKHIDPPDKLTNWEGPAKKKKKKSAKKAAKPTVETPVIVNDVVKNSSSSNESAYSAVPLN